MRRGEFRRELVDGRRNGPSAAGAMSNRAP